MNSAQLSHLKHSGAVAVVLGPDTPLPTVDVLNRMGAGWRGGVRAWRELPFAYALLLADSRKRVRRLAPLALLARDTASLLEVVGQACDRMAGKTCLWYVTDAGAAGAAVQLALAEDAATAGRA